MTLREGFTCSDCNVNVRQVGELHYMIKSEIWLTVAHSNELLCVGCLESRLNRYLVPDDFNNRPVNNKKYGHKSARLLNRLEGSRINHEYNKNNT